MNQTYSKIEQRVVDLQHGLAFAPTCHWVKGYPQARASRALLACELVVLTLGRSVPLGGTRQQLLDDNATLFRKTVIPALTGFGGVVLVVTNPVEALVQQLHEEAGIAAERCLGLGTVVETARLRAALAKRMRPMRTPREVFAYAVGTHDENFVPVTEGATAMAAASFKPASIESARRETVSAASRVKQDARSTLHPVVEGILAVVEAVASDRRSVLTVTAHDPVLDLFYSVPCTLGRQGVLERHTELLETPEVRQRLEPCLRALREQRASLALVR